MGKIFDQIDDKMHRWLMKQPMFVVATAPSEGGHVNASPKGMGGSFAVLGPQQVGYLDYTGSGAETIAHVRDNGRVTLMFTAFEGPPKIVRLQGIGRIVYADAPDFADLRAQFVKTRDAGLRSIIVIDLDRISDSCGFSVPKMDFVEDRDILDKDQERRDPAFFPSYWHKKNALSVDGLPAIDAPVKGAAP